MCDFCCNYGAHKNHKADLVINLEQEEKKCLQVLSERAAAVSLKLNERVAQLHALLQEMSRVHQV